MALSFAVTETLVTATFAGVVSDDDFLRGAVEMRRVADENADINELVDFSAVERFEIATQTIIEVASHPPHFSDKSRQAFVAPTDIAFGVMRMYQMHTERLRPNMRVFRRMQQAMQWLASGSSETQDSLEIR